MDSSIINLDDVSFVKGENGWREAGVVSVVAGSSQIVRVLADSGHDFELVIECSICVLCAIVSLAYLNIGTCVDGIREVKPGVWINAVWRLEADKGLRPE